MGYGRRRWIRGVETDGGSRLWRGSWCQVGKEKKRRSWLRQWSGWLLSGHGRREANEKFN